MQSKKVMTFMELIRIIRWNTTMVETLDSEEICWGKGDFLSFEKQENRNNRSKCATISLLQIH